MMIEALHLDRKRILQQHKKDFQPLDIGKDEHRMSKEDIRPTNPTKDEHQTSRENIQSIGIVKDERQIIDESHPEDHSQAESRSVVALIPPQHQLTNDSK